ncbi:MAG: hypothetical protein IPK79_06510 [Vampirovibrionales bacterium]|nr:hypothetical protein [Vampirovibrionales bacterium]
MRAIFFSKPFEDAESLKEAKTTLEKSKMINDISAGNFDNSNWQALDTMPASAHLLDKPFIEHLFQENPPINQKNALKKSGEQWALMLGSAGTRTNDGTIKQDVVD